MEDVEYQRPEGRLIAAALAAQPESIRKIAGRIGISDARLRQIVNGYQPAGKGQRIEVVGTPGRLAMIARVLGIKPSALREAGRDDAAEVLERIITDDHGLTETELGAHIERVEDILKVQGIIDQMAEQVSARVRADIANDPELLEKIAAALADRELSEEPGRPVLEIAAHEEEVPISGEQLEPDSP